MRFLETTTIDGEALATYLRLGNWRKDVNLELMNEIELRSLSGTMALMDACKSVDATMYIVE